MGKKKERPIRIRSPIGISKRWGTKVKKGRKKDEEKVDIRKEIEDGEVS